MDEKSPKTAADKIAERSSFIEEQIRESNRRKEQRQFLEELGKRVSIAREGRQLIEKGDYTNGLKCLRRFLSITARSFEKDVHELKPEMIDPKTRQAECLLISSIFFDLMKLLDKLDTAEAREERKLYHRMFIRFTVGQNFQTFAAENLRKYLMYRKSVRNRSEFWATYQAIRVKRFCFVATWSFGSEEHPVVCQLREFRDGPLAKYAAGRALVRVYYRQGPRAAALLSMIPGGKRGCRWVLAKLASIV
jgi:hypothetical protein